MLDQIIIAIFEWPTFLVSIDPSLVWTASVLVAVAYAVVHARRSALEPRAIYWLSVWALLGGMWGARLLNLTVHGSNGGSLPWLYFWDGGQSYFGGILGGTLAGTIYLRLRSLPLLRYADAVVPALSLGYGIGRVGCFLNGCDFGTLSNFPWAVRYAPGTEAQASHFADGLITSTSALSLAVHPVQLYSSMLGFCLFLTFSRWKFRDVGSRCCMFAVLYGSARFAMEWFRGDATAAIGPLSLPQVCSLIFALSGIGVWLSLHRGALKSMRDPWLGFRVIRTRNAKT
jgi:phosphatidylglycerol:prolipoprotein diacylglycerol transferase